jgi:hypothetical protein
MTGVSIDGLLVLKPGSWSPLGAAAVPEAAITRARAAQTTSERLLIAPPRVVVRVV